MDPRTPAPDLASVLKTLSSFVPPGPEPQDQSSRDDDYDPLHFSPLQSFDGTITAPIQPQIQPQQHSQRPLHTLPPSRDTTLPDPSTITAWSAALRFVMKTVAQNEAMQSRIRRLIRSQHEHERKWWEAREALISKQTSRAEKQQKLDEVLRSIGGAITTGPEMTTPEDHTAEIQNYDKKVYKAMSDMSRALDTELRGLGIPFFAIRHDLLLAQTAKQENKPGSGSSPARMNRKETLTAEDLRHFQQRMFDLLEDLCKE